MIFRTNISAGRVRLWEYVCEMCNIEEVKSRKGKVESVLEDALSLFPSTFNNKVRSEWPSNTY